MPTQDRELVEAAEAASMRAIAPHSGFKVGAAARLIDGEVITASNIESEVYPAGLCAERGLLFNHQSNYAERPILSLAIASDPSERECYPCGFCRQTMVDVERRQHQPIRIIMWGGGSATVVESAEALLPFSFKL